MAQIFNTLQIIPIQYTQSQIYAIQRMKINKLEILNYHGYNYDLDMNALIDFFKSIGENNHEDCVTYARLISDITQMVCTIKNRDSCWLSVRARIPDDEYHIPRFHCDGVFFPLNRDETEMQKFILTIKGPGTLVTEPNKEIIKEFYELFRKTLDTQLEIETRKKYVKILNKGLIYQLTNNQGAIITTFKSGDPLHSTIHSEPDITHHSRLFISIVPGTNEQITDLKNRYLSNKKDYKKNI